MTASSLSNDSICVHRQSKLKLRDQGWILDFKKFYIYLKDKYHVSKSFLFIGFIPDKAPLYRKLRSYGYKLIFKPTLQLKTKVKGNVDAELVLHAMIQLPNYGKAIIVSGDGDFHCLVEYLQTIGKLEELIVPNARKYSALLRQFMGRIVFINSSLRKRLEQKGRH